MQVLSLYNVAQPGCLWTWPPASFTCHCVTLLHFLEMRGLQHENLRKECSDDKSCQITRSCSAWLAFNMATCLLHLPMHTPPMAFICGTKCNMGEGQNTRYEGGGGRGAQVSELSTALDLVTCRSQLPWHAPGVKCQMEHKMPSWHLC